MISVADVARVFGPNIKAWEKSVFTFNKWRSLKIPVLESDFPAWPKPKLTLREQLEIEDFCENT